MSNADWLAQLAPDRAPPPPGWWPLAPGWWGLAALALIGLVAAAWWYRRRQGGIHRWQRAALQALQALDNASLSDRELAAQLQDLLRRYALVRHGPETVARLSGQSWLDFVVTHGGASWAGEAGQQLLRQAYGAPESTVPQADRARWLDGARSFLKDHKP